uniref:Uncharacterized protein n=1 Tax=Arundo donax TaxID=35708 RepID=A0A0A9DGB0_ARUDO
MFLYAASRPRVNFSPSQTGDFIISSRRLILSSCKAVTSDAKSNAKLTYSSSVLATNLPNPARKAAICQYATPYGCKSHSRGGETAWFDSQNILLVAQINIIYIQVFMFIYTILQQIINMKRGRGKVNLRCRSYI